MNTATMPIPGALRLRRIHPLIDGDGSCSLIYDVERAAVLDVPMELQFHIAPALETGDLDEDLLSWLVNEDLVTAARLGGYGEAVEEAAGLEAGVWWSLGSVHRGDGEVHARIENPAEEDLGDTLDFIFKQCLGTLRVNLHLGWHGSFPGAGPLAAAVVEASRRAAAARVEVAFELTLDARAVSPAALRFLADYPVHVRLRCGSFPAADPASDPGAAAAWQGAERAARRLLEALPERVTIECRLAGGARLHDLWQWVREAGVRHLDVARAEGPGWAEGTGWVESPSELRTYRGDLLAVYEEMCSDLEARRPAVDYRPLTRVVRNLMRGARAAGLARPFGFHRDLPVGDAPAADGFFPGLPGLGLAGEEGEEEADADGFPCRGCWARYVCPHSAIAGPPLAGDRREPSRERCAVWRTEVEVALRFYHRLAHADPMQVMRLFSDALGVPAEPALDPPGAGGQPKVF